MLLEVIVRSKLAALLLTTLLCIAGWFYLQSRTNGLLNLSPRDTHFDNLSNFRPFVDSVSDEPRSLIGEVNDISRIIDLYNPEGPRFDTTEYPLYDVELIGSSPFKYIVWAGYVFFKDDQSIGVRDSHYQLLTSPSFETPDPNLEYRELYQNILQNRKADSFALSLGVSQNSTERQSTLIEEIGLKKALVFGKSVIRDFADGESLQTYEAGHHLLDWNQRAQGDRISVNFPELSSDTHNIVSRGLGFEISNVESVFVVNRDHSLDVMKTVGERWIGSMSAQTFGVVDTSGKSQVLSFIGSDSLELSLEDGVLSVTVYEYSVRERTTRGSDNSPDETGLRIHPNLGVTNKLPTSRVVINIVDSNTIAFPLWQPSGYLSALSITEHADFNGVEQDNLVMYGNIQGRFEAGMGLLGNKIAITKSVFPTGNASHLPITNPDTGETVQVRQANVEDHSKFRNQLSDYANHGDVEIALHCAGLAIKQGKSTESLTEILKEMSRAYGSTTWVDHGGVECLWETGWDPQAESYLLPGLKASGYKYLSARDDKFGSNISLIADNEPGNILFYVPRFDDDLTDDWRVFHFTTSDFVPSEDHFSISHLESIIRNRGFQNWHAYMPVFVLTVQNGTLAKHDWYEPGLENIAKLRDRGDLFIATTEVLLDYVLAVRELDYVGINGTIHVFSHDAIELTDMQPTFAVLNFSGDQKTQTVTMVPDVTLREKTADGTLYVFPTD